MIKIRRNTNGDSRVAKGCPTFTDFTVSNNEHIVDVSKIMKEVGKRIADRGDEHDWSKTIEPYKSMFYRDLCNTIDGKMDFMDGEWAKFHYSTERHHLLKNVPDNVNLIDVIEMICDCVAAGLARSGEVRPLEIDESILKKALHNTVDMIVGMCELEEST